MNVKKSVFLLGLALFPALLFSQSGFVIGYNIGTYRAAHRNLQAYSQMYNLAAGPELIEPMSMTGFYRGIVLGWKIADDNFMAGIRWSTKKVVGHAGENATGTEKLRIRMNTINMEFGLGGEFVKAGISIDVGGLRVHKKTTNKQTGVETNWEKFYDGGGLIRSGALATGITLFLDIHPSRYLEMRPYIQIPLATMEISDDRTRRDYAHPIGNIGFSLCFVLSTDD